MFSRRWQLLHGQRRALVQVHGQSRILHLNSTRWLQQQQRHSISSSSVLFKKSKGNNNHESIIPGSQLILPNAADREEYEKTKTKMHSAVEWFRKDCAQAESRASGRVSTALLDGVFVAASRGGSGSPTTRLDELATIGIKDGSTILITLFDEQNTKAVEQALYASKLPNIVPQRQDARTIKIPIPKPTVDLKETLYNQASRKAEDQRVHCRKLFQAAIKKGKYKKHSEELDVFQKLEHDQIAAIDKILRDLKKAINVK